MKKLKKTAQFTIEPGQPANFNQFPPEFGRVADLTRQFGIKRGTT